MKKLLFIIIISIISLSSTFAYKELIIHNIADKPVRVIKVILDWEHYVVSSIALDWWNTLEALTEMVGWDTSINGSFFCPEDYTYCEGYTHTISERIFLWEAEKYSKYRSDMWIRWVFGFDIDGEPLFVQHNESDMPWLNLDYNIDKINKLYFWLWNFPVLLVDWENVLRGAEHTMDKKMRTAGNKHFICSTKDEKTIYMWVVWGVDMYMLTTFIKKHFDCYNAINLDAGNSAAMIYDWKVLQRSPRRFIMDAFVVLTKDEYKQFTNHTPPTKTKYKPANQYKLTLKDQEYILHIVDICEQILEKYGQDLKRKIIALARNVISSDKNQNYRAQTIRNEILIRLYTIDYLK